MNLTRVSSMFYKTWPLWTVHSILSWQRKVFFYLLNIFKLPQIRMNKMTLKTYDVSFSVYYQGFYDSSVFDNMTDSVLEFLESGRMNGSGRFSTWCLVLSLAEIWLDGRALLLEQPCEHQIENLERINWYHPWTRLYFGCSGRLPIRCNGIFWWIQCKCHKYNSGFSQQTSILWRSRVNGGAGEQLKQL